MLDNVGDLYLFGGRALTKRLAFTLIEILAVVLIIAVLMAIAMPLYLASLKDGYAKTANDQAKAICAAIQTEYVAWGVNDSGGYATTYTGNTNKAKLQADLNGGVPTNPCYGTNSTTDPTVAFTIGAAISSTKTGVSVIAKNDGRCNDSDLSAASVGY